MTKALQKNTLQIFYSTTEAGILRICRTNNTIFTFCNAANTLIWRIVKEGSKLKTINKILNKVFGHYFDVVENFVARRKIFFKSVLFSFSFKVIC